MHCSSAINFIAGLHSYAFQNCAATHLCPTFYMQRVCRHNHCLYSYVLKLSAVNIADQCSYRLQNLVGTHHCPTCIHPACTPSISMSCIRTHCRTSLRLGTSVLNSRYYSSGAIAAGQICTRCSFTVNIADLPSYMLQDLVGTHHCHTFVHTTPLLPFPLHTTRQL